MRVVVYRQRAAQRYDRISAVGIGHLRKDLILVPDGEGAKPIEIKPEDWTRLTINRNTERRVVVRPVTL